MDKDIDEIRVVVTSAIELKAGHKYLICVDSAALARDQIVKLTEALKKLGIEHAVALMTHGDPLTAVKVIEQEPTNE